MFRLKRRFTGCLAFLVLGLGLGGHALAQAPLADPTRPPVSTSGDLTGSVQRTTKWTLTSTLIGPQRRVAVINGQPLGVGGIIDGAVVVAVEPGRASLRHGDRIIQVELMAGAVKRAAKPVN